MLCLCKVPLGCCKKSTIPNWKQHLEGGQQHICTLCPAAVSISALFSASTCKRKKSVFLMSNFLQPPFFPKNLVWKMSTCWPLSEASPDPRNWYLKPGQSFFLWLRAGSTISELPYHFTLCLGDGICPARSSHCNKATKVVGSPWSLCQPKEGTP